MKLFRHLRQLAARNSRHNRAAEVQVSKPKPTFKPQLEILEQRDVPSATSTALPRPKAARWSAGITH